MYVLLRALHVSKGRTNIECIALKAGAYTHQPEGQRTYRTSLLFDPVPCHLGRDPAWDIPVSQPCYAEAKQYQVRFNELANEKACDADLRMCRFLEVFLIF